MWHVCLRGVISSSILSAARPAMHVLPPDIIFTAAGRVH